MPFKNEKRMKKQQNLLTLTYRVARSTQTKQLSVLCLSI